MRIGSIRPEHVEFVPRELDEGTLYISKRFNTAAHKCCCGCGVKIVTPLRATEYELIQSGEYVSIRPSIGNWNHPCRSHYWIRDNRIVWAGQMTDEEIRAGRAHDDTVKDAYFSKAQWPWSRKAASRVKSWFDRIFGKH